MTTGYSHFNKLLISLMSDFPSDSPIISKSTVQCFQDTGFFKDREVVDLNPQQMKISP